MQEVAGSSPAAATIKSNPCSSSRPIQFQNGAGFFISLLAPIRQKCVSQVRFWASHFNGRRHFGRRPVVSLRVSYRYMAQTALELHLMLANDNSWAD